MILETVCRLRSDDDYQGLSPPCKSVFILIGSCLNFLVTGRSLFNNYPAKSRVISSDT